MPRYFTILFFVCSLLSLHSFGQGDPFPGNWQMEYNAPGNIKVSIRLQIGVPEKNVLFPAEMHVQCEQFAAVYHLLLVKRNLRQLAIGRNKVACVEKPFSLGAWPVMLNGVFDLNRDLKGNLFLSAERIFTKDFLITMAAPASLGKDQQAPANALYNILKDAEWKLKKTGNEPFHGPYVDTILNPSLGKDYYGLMDTVFIRSRDAVLSFSGNKKTDNGTVSVMLNGNTVIDQNDLTVKKPREEITLDTGLNILVFFADNYGKTPRSTGKLNLDFGNKKRFLDFAEAKNLAATFIVAQYYFEPEKEKENAAYSSLLGSNLSASDMQRDIKLYHYPDPEERNLLKTDSAKAVAQKTLFRDAHPIGNLQTNTRKVILALWDDAVEDGDSISLNINGHWIVQGFPVRKKPQFIAVSLDPGPNRLMFIADNLGSIIPNTAVLEIIDEHQRKSFMIETDLRKNNLVDILYEIKPGD